MLPNSFKANVSTTMTYIIYPKQGKLTIKLLFLPIAKIV